MLSWPQRAAGPPGKRLARTIVGNMDPQPDSTITTPRISPLALGTTTLKMEKKYHITFLVERTNLILKSVYF